MAEEQITIILDMGTSTQIPVSFIEYIRDRHAVLTVKCTDGETHKISSQTLRKLQISGRPEDMMNVQVLWGQA